MAELCCSLRVSKAWKVLLDGNAHLWRLQCSALWAGKAYVPASLRELANGEFPSPAVAANAEAAEREALLKLKIRELKGIMRSLRMTVMVGDLIEKDEFAAAILDAL